MGFLKQKGMGGNEFYSKKGYNDYLEFQFESIQEGLQICIGLEDCTLEIGHLSFVHQLQNLYFALTGTELTLKHP